MRKNLITAFVTLLALLSVNPAAARLVTDRLIGTSFTSEPNNNWDWISATGESGAEYYGCGRNNVSGSDGFRWAGTGYGGGLWVTSSPGKLVSVSFQVSVANYLMAFNSNLYGSDTPYEGVPTATQLQNFQFSIAMGNPSATKDFSYTFENEETAFGFAPCSTSPATINWMVVTWDVTDDDVVPDTPLVYIDNEEATADNYTLTEGTPIKVTSKNAGAIAITGAVNTTVEKSSYSFNLETSGEYTFTGVNGALTSDPRTLNLNVGTPEKPVLTVSGETVDDGAEIQASSITATSQYATAIVVTGPADYNETFEGSSCTVAIKIAGQYSFVAKNSTTTTEAVTVNVTFPTYTQLTKDTDLVVGRKVIIGAKEFDVVMSSTVKINPTQSAYTGLQGVAATFIDDTYSGPDAVVLTLQDDSQYNDFTGELIMSGYKLIDETTGLGLRIAAGSDTHQLSLSNNPSTLEITFGDDGTAYIGLKGGNVIRLSTQQYPSGSGSPINQFSPWAKTTWKNVQLFGEYVEVAPTTVSTLGLLAEATAKWPGTAVTFTGTAAITGHFGNEVWMLQDNEAISMTASVLDADVAPGKAVSNFAVTYTDADGYVMTTLPESITDCEEPAIPEVTEITDADRYKLVQLNGSATFSGDTGVLTTTGGAEITLLNNITTDSPSQSHQTLLWQVGQTWPQTAIENAHVAGFVDIYNGNPVLRTILIGETIITGIDEIIVDNATDSNARYYTIGGIELTGKPTPGLYIVRRGDKISKVIVK